MKTYVEANLEANLTKIMTGFPFEKKKGKFIKSILILIE